MSTIGGIKQILQQVMILYLYRTEMSEILKRPDNKQEIVRGFQKSFNDISADLRSEDAMKAELHLRVDVRVIHQ